MRLDYSRRQFLFHSAALAVTTQLGGCTGNKTQYTNINLQTRKLHGPNPDSLELVRYATLAANGHNTQPWLFNVSNDQIRLLPDLSRRTPVVDPDDHHLFASLGCAAENLSIAARTQGKSGDVAIEFADRANIVVDTNPTTASASPLFNAITQRQVTRSLYKGKSAPVDVLQRLEQAASSYGVSAYLITDTDQMEDMLELVVAGNSRQMDNPEFVQELKDWIRFNGGEAAKARDGLYSACSGNPDLPSLVGPTMFNFFFKKDAENDKYRDHIRSSSGLMVFVADRDNPEGWISAGRAYEKFALQATLDNVKHAFVNQAVEELAMQAELRSLLDLGDQRPNLVVRFGYAEPLPMSIRRAVVDVLV